MNKKIVLGVAALLLLALASFASPWWSVWQMRSAAQAGDAEKLAEYVDFPALRESLKAEFFATVTKPMLEDPKMKDNPFAGLGVMIANAMIGPMVDAMISPSGLASMLAGNRPSVTPKPTAAESTPARTEKTERAPTTSDRVSQGHDDFSHFSIRAQFDKNPPQDMAMIFRRDGPFTWKLASIKLPRQAMQ